MHLSNRVSFLLALLAAGAMPAALLMAAAPPKKPHIVVLGAVRQVPYSKAGDPAGAAADETKLATRPLLVDGKVSEWTTGEMHPVTERSFVVRRAVKINDALPEDAVPKDGKSQAAKATDVKAADVKEADAGKSGVKAAEIRTAGAAHWVWQRGPWLLVDRVTGHATVLKLPDYDPAVSQVAWFRDYAAYCGVTPSGKSLYAIVAQLGVRKRVVSRKLAGYDAEDRMLPSCGLPEWQREPLGIAFHVDGRKTVTYDLSGGAAALTEDGDAEPEKTPEP
jgi:hypothetical protein